MHLAAARPAPRTRAIVKSEDAPSKPFAASDNVGESPVGGTPTNANAASASATWPARTCARANMIIDKRAVSVSPSCSKLLTASDNVVLAVSMSSRASAAIPRLAFAIAASP